MCRLRNQLRSGISKLFITQNLASDCFAFNVRQDHEGRPNVARTIGNEFRHRDSGIESRLYDSSLNTHIADIALALTLQDQRAVISLEAPGFTRSPTAQSCQIGDCLGTEFTTQRLTQLLKR